MVNMGGGFGGFSMQMQQHCPSCGGRGKVRELLEFRRIETIARTAEGRR